MLIDTHCHLADEKFASDLEAVVARARDAGVERAICILSADEPDEVARAAVVSAAWPEVRYSTGVHPHRAGGFAGDPGGAAEAARRSAAAVDAVAIGEIGLDYHYDFAPRDVQRAVFEAQLALALELDRPVVIHTREAWADTMAVLRAAGPRLRGVMHCFTGSAAEAVEAVEIGFHVSFAGILTFPRAESLREAARVVPEDRLLVETDAPYLAPVPHRGKRNEPAWVAETAMTLAKARGADASSLQRRLHANTIAFFGLSGPPHEPANTPSPR